MHCYQKSDGRLWTRCAYLFSLPRAAGFPRPVLMLWWQRGRRRGKRSLTPSEKPRSDERGRAMNKESGDSKAG